MANIYTKSMSEALKEARDYRDTSDIDERKDVEEVKEHLSYDEWLKEEKGIKEGAHGINSDEHAKYSTEWKNYVTEIVGGRGEMTITKDGGVMIIKTKDWQTYKAKGWEKKEEVGNESLELPATGAITSNSTGQEDESEELDEASRLRPIKGLYTMAQMKKQVARTEKAFKEFEQHCDFIFQMDADIGPSMGDNSGKYWNVHKVLDNANNQIKKALADAKRIT